ncbi:hypothetical protein R3P38DRAFT_3183755 [Favolaschia claudopus]|uniref:Secreted protein n=1 Tax=Favolaschia claudopus TaxID=2862362 RepID=A0AAW0C9H6_9AGAR
MRICCFSVVVLVYVSLLPRAITIPVVLDPINAKPASLLRQSYTRRAVDLVKGGKILLSHQQLVPSPAPAPTMSSSFSISTPTAASTSPLPASQPLPGTASSPVAKVSAFKLRKHNSELKKPKTETKTHGHKTNAMNESAE